MSEKIIIESSGNSEDFFIHPSIKSECLFIIKDENETTEEGNKFQT